ncbi:MAG: hypothetical protein CMM52_14475 [Rhodospirillaceae bacterium]|nr:hypothetical protein [Rhodospirillaceae bacterium]|tara:strand:+ start:45999 stop:46904 length:906 start_codon:yes stop_codon:yes gene_type:complete
MRRGRTAAFAALITLGQIAGVGGAELGKQPGSANGIKGVDNRTIVDSSKPPWNAIGRVSTSAGLYCTGVLIAPDRVATAAHCLWRKKTLRWLPVYEISFLAGYRAGKYEERAAIESYFLPNGLVDQKSRSLKNNSDWAVLKLRQPIRASIKPIPLANFTMAIWKKLRRQGLKLIQAGYSYDQSETLTQHIGCSITLFFRSNGLMYHNCDATHGDSGSPIMIERNGRYEIVGLHIATRRFDKSVASGVAITGHGITNTLMNLARRGVEVRMVNEEKAGFRPVQPVHNPIGEPLESVPSLAGR